MASDQQYRFIMLIIYPGSLQQIGLMSLNCSQLLVSKTVSYAVPQGSVVGLMLINIYVTAW